MARERTRSTAGDARWRFPTRRCRALFPLPLPHFFAAWEFLFFFLVRPASPNADERGKPVEFFLCRHVPHRLHVVYSFLFLLLRIRETRTAVVVKEEEEEQMAVFPSLPRPFRFLWNGPNEIRLSSPSPPPPKTTTTMTTRWYPSRMSWEASAKGCLPSPPPPLLSTVPW